MTRGHRVRLEIIGKPGASAPSRRRPRSQSSGNPQLSSPGVMDDRNDRIPARRLSVAAAVPSDPITHALPGELSAGDQVAALLNRRLADAIDLETRCKQAHWNAKGPNFVALQELFGDIGDDVESYVEGLARRVVQLGGIAEGSPRVVAERSGLLNEYPIPIAAGDEHVRSVGDALAAFGARVRNAIHEANRLEDRESAEICAEISRGVERWLRFLKAHLQAWT